MVRVSVFQVTGFSRVHSGVKRSHLGTGDVRGGCDTLPWSLLLRASPRTQEEEDQRQAPGTRHSLHPVCPLSPIEAPLTWEALLYGCPKCGKDMVAVPGPPLSSLSSSRLSPTVRRSQQCGVSVPYTVAGAQRRFLRLVGPSGGRAEGSPAAEPCAPEGAPPARGVRKTEGPMDGQGKEEDVGSQRRVVARWGAARRGAVRLRRCPSPRWPEAQCDVTVIPSRQTGPRAPGPRATKRAKRSQPVRARALSPTLTLAPGGLCSWRGTSKTLTLSARRWILPLFARSSGARAHTHNLSKLPGRSRRNASLWAAQAPGAARSPPPLRPGEGERQPGRRGRREYKRRDRRKVGEKGKREKEEGRGETWVWVNRGARGRGRELGWAKAGRRLSTGRWRRAEARGRSLQPGFSAPALKESLFTPQARLLLEQLRAASVDPTGPPIFVLGDLVPRLSLPRTWARFRLSKPWRPSPWPWDFSAAAWSSSRPDSAPSRPRLRIPQIRSGNWPGQIPGIRRLLAKIPGHLFRRQGLAASRAPPAVAAGQPGRLKKAPGPGCSPCAPLGVALESRSGALREGGPFPALLLDARLGPRVRPPPHSIPGVFKGTLMGGRWRGRGEARWYPGGGCLLQA